MHIVGARLPLKDIVVELTNVFDRVLQRHIQSRGPVVPAIQEYAQPNRYVLHNPIMTLLK